MAQGANDLTALVIATEVAPIVVAAASVAEVLARVALLPVPGTYPWVLGFFVWRQQPVNVISFEAMAGGPVPVMEPSRIVVFYPLPGRGKEDYFAIATNREPRSLIVTNDTQGADLPAGLSSEFIAGAMQSGDQVIAIPDFTAMRKAFYGA